MAATLKSRQVGDVIVSISKDESCWEAVPAHCGVRTRSCGEWSAVGASLEYKDHSGATWAHRSGGPVCYR